MFARLTAYPPDSAAIVRLLDDGVSYRIGRASDCEVRIEHASVSRYHAELVSRSGSWRLHDTGSKNGLRVHGNLALVADFSTSGWFSIGDVHCAIEPLDEAATDAHRAAGLSRRSELRILSAQLQPGLGLGGLIPQTLDIVLQLSGLERGFMLYGGADEPLRVRANRGVLSGEISSSRFAGSASAVDRAIETRKTVVCGDTIESPWLGARPSVRSGGIRAVVCVPLGISGGARGVIYLDSRKPGPPVTDLDLEMVETVAAQAAAAIEAARMQVKIDELAVAVDQHASKAPTWSQLRRASDRR
jgi:GAF domain-containing protein